MNVQVQEVAKGIPMQEQVPKSAQPSKRLLSIEAVRGLDMLMLAGAGACISTLHGKTDLAWVDALALQFEHPDWNGFTFYDFIFPLFLFIAGLSLPFSLSKGMELGM